MSGLLIDQYPEEIHTKQSCPCDAFTNIYLSIYLFTSEFQLSIFAYRNQFLISKKQYLNV